MNSMIDERLRDKNEEIQALKDDIKAMRDDMKNMLSIKNSQAK